MSTRRTGLAAALSLATLLLAAACATTDTQASAPSSGEQRQLFDEQCRDTVIPELPDLAPIEADADAPAEQTVDTEFGEAVLPTDPEAALGMYTTDVDLLIWLGYPLAASQPIRGDSGYETFPCYFPFEQLEGVSTFANYPDYDYEGVLLAKPDLVLNGLGYDKKTDKRLREIAPTYSVNAFDGRSWVDHFRETAEALGRTERYEMFDDYYQQRLAEVKETIGDAADGLVVAPVSIWEGDLYSGCYSGVECQVFEDLGLTIDPVALSNDREGVKLSAEQAGRLKGIDWAFTTKALGAVGEKQFQKDLAESKRSTIFADLPFVAQNHIATYEMEMTYGSPSGQLAFLDVVEKALAS